MHIAGICICAGVKRAVKARARRNLKSLQRPGRKPFGCTAGVCICAAAARCEEGGARVCHRHGGCPAGAQGA